MKIRYDNKIIWRVDLAKELHELFYPTLFGKTIKKLDSFSHIVVHDLPLTKTLFFDTFYPLYAAHVMTKQNYRLSDQFVKEYMTNKFELGTAYRLLGTTDVLGNFQGGIIYRVKKNLAYIAYRAFNREVFKKAKLPVSIDYFFEFKLLEQLKKNGVSELSHGMDIQPRIEGIGLPLFKLKIGASPKVYKGAVTKTLNSKEIKKITSSKGAFFFDDPDSDNFYTSGHFYIGKDTEPNLINEVEKVFTWKGIILNIHRLN